MQETQEGWCNGAILGQKRTLEEEMATHSSVLAWRIPGTEEPGGLQSMGHTRVHTHMHTHTHTLLLMLEAAVMVGNTAVSHLRPHLINEFVWIPSQS